MHSQELQPPMELNFKRSKHPVGEVGLLRGHALVLNALVMEQAIGYYGGMLAYYWVVATPAVGFLFGFYLYVAVNLFHCHYDEAFSSLRIPHYKGFSRIHLTETGDLVVYAVAMDQVTLPSTFRALITLFTFDDWRYHSPLICSLSK